LGPDGFAQNISGNGIVLTTTGINYASASRRIINTAHAVYELDLEHRATKAIYSITNDSEAATPSAITNMPNETIGGIGEVSLNGNDWDYTIVVTRGYIRLLTPDGKVLWRAAYKPGYPDYNQIQVTFLDSRNQFALWLGPSWYAQGKAGGKLPTQVVWLDREQGVLKNTDLPELFHNGREFAREQKLISLSISRRSW